jgi:hypothetical protein
MSIRAHRFVAAGALAVAAVAAPVAIALSSGTAAEQVAGPPCLAWFGNQEDGVCLSYSNGQGFTGGTPDLGYYGPNSGTSNGRGGGIGITTGPLMPGTTWTEPIG